MSTILIKFVQLMLSFTILVLVHELGHYLLARLFRVRVDKFYIFFNPWFSLFKYKPKGSDTEWGIGWLPFGGYCKINGMIDESLDRSIEGTTPQPYEFRSKPAWQRFLIMVAGVVFNFLLAIVIYAGIIYTWGRDELPSARIENGMAFSPVAEYAGFRDGDIILATDGRPADILDAGFMRSVAQAESVQVRREGVDTTLLMPDDLMKRLLLDGRGLMYIRFPFVVGEVVPGKPAERAGLKAGDKLLAIEGRKVDEFRQARAEIHSRRGQVVPMTFERNGEVLDLSVPIDTAGQIGVLTEMDLSKLYQVDHHSYNLIEAVPAGVRLGVTTLKGYVGDMKYVFTPEGASQIGGFGSIGNLFPPVWDWRAFWSMTALLSVILSVMNLLPIPALDGGHIVFLLIEMITRRKMKEQWLIRAQLIGMFLLFALMIYANVKDLVRFL